MKSQMLIIFIAIVFVGCNTKKQPEGQTLDPVVEQKLPEGSIPIHFNGHIYFKGTIDSLQGNYLFDTGADNLYLDQVYYDENAWGFADVSQAMIGGAGTQMESVPLIKDEISFSIDSSGSFSTSWVAVLKLKEILGDYIDGLLGWEIFKGSILEIDYDDEYVRVYHSLDSLNLTAYAKIPMTNEQNRFYLPLDVQINPTMRIKGDFLLDLGSGGSIGFTSTAASRYGMNGMSNPKALCYTKYGGIGGDGAYYSFIADSMYIGGCPLGNILVTYSLNKKGALSSQRHNGLLGNDVLKNFDILIDFINEDLYLKPNTFYGADLDDIPTLGFGYVNRSRTLKAWVVSSMYKDSNAEKSGLRIDDHIIQVNGKSILDITYGEESQIFEDQETVDLVVIRDGVETLHISFEKKRVF